MKRVAIIGGPGVGCTTLLQALAKVNNQSISSLKQDLPIQEKLEFEPVKETKRNAWRSPKFYSKFYKRRMK